MVLGGGRETKESVIDLSVGIVLNKKTGDYAAKGDTLATFYANDTARLEDALSRFEGAYCIGENPVRKQKLIRHIITEELP